MSASTPQEEQQIRICDAEKKQERVKTTKRHMANFSLKIGAKEAMLADLELAYQKQWSRAIKTAMAKTIAEKRKEIGTTKAYKARLSNKHVDRMSEKYLTALEPYASYARLSALPTKFLIKLAAVATVPDEEMAGDSKKAVIECAIDEFDFRAWCNGLFGDDAAQSGTRKRARRQETVAEYLSRPWPERSVEATDDDAECSCDDCCNGTTSTYGPPDGCRKDGTRNTSKD